MLGEAAGLVGAVLKRCVSCVCGGTGCWFLQQKCSCPSAEPQGKLSALLHGVLGSEHPCAGPGRDELRVLAKITQKWAGLGYLWRLWVMSLVLSLAAAGVLQQKQLLNA